MKIGRASALLAGAVLCFASVACGSDDSSGGSTTGSPTAAKPSKGAITFETTEPSERKVAITGPAAVEAGVTRITLRNSGTRPHDAQIVRVLNDLRTTDEVISRSVDSEEGAPIPYWITDGGGLGTVAPGESATVTERLESGTYYVLDGESPKGSATPNARLGGVTKFEVVNETSAPLFGTGVRIAARDHYFRTVGIKPGANHVTFHNVGQQFHQIAALPLVGGATLADAREYLETGGESGGRPPVDFENAIRTAAIDGGQRQIMWLDFKKGKYALVCFLNDRNGGRSHFAKGMIDELDVK
jgi:hypothetical protein